MSMPTADELSKTFADHFGEPSLANDVDTRDGVTAGRDAILDALIAEAERDKIPDSEGGWDIRYDVANWLRSIKDGTPYDDQESTWTDGFTDADPW